MDKTFDQKHLLNIQHVCMMFTTELMVITQTETEKF